MVREALTVAVLALCALPCAVQMKAGGQCLSYEPAEVKLTGKLIRKTFPGPPNYDSVKNGDRPETYWLVQLAKPACVNRGAAEPDLDPEQKNVRMVQLVLNAGMYKTHASLIGKQVVATGTLFGRIVAHHHTPVLLTVKSLESAAASTSK